MFKKYKALNTFECSPWCRKPSTAAGVSGMLD